MQQAALIVSHLLHALGTVLGAPILTARHTVPHIPFIVTLTLLVRTTQ